MTRPYFYSPSRVEEAESCTRKWWAKARLKMPDPKGPGTKIGTALHKQIEAVLLGEPTFQPGWNIVPADKNSPAYTLSPHECELVKYFIDEGQKQCIIAPMPGQEIEREFEFPLPQGLGSYTGKIDLYYSHGIRDHKSMKRAQYAKNEGKLANDLQMLSYAYVWFQRNPGRDECELSHDQFILGIGDKPPVPQVKDVKIKVRRDVVERAWTQRILVIIQRMSEVLDAPEADWFKVPGPHRKGACSDFGGCPFEKICNRLESPAEYRDRIQRAATPAITTTANVTMSNSRFAALAGIAAAPATTPAPAPSAPAPSAAPAQPAAPTPATERAPAAAPAVGSVIIHDADAPREVARAPWGSADCTNENCRGRGYTDQGKSCIPCGKIWKKAQGTNASDVFQTFYDNQTFRLSWIDPKTLQTHAISIAKGGSSVPAVATAAPTTQTKPAETVRPAPAVVAPVAAAAEALGAPLLANGKPQAPGLAMHTPMSQEALLKAAKLEDETLTNGGPSAGVVMVPMRSITENLAREAAVKDWKASQGFTLVVGAVPLVRNGAQVLDLDLKFREITTEIAKATGAESFYALPDVWKRRDAVRALGQRLIAQGIKEAFVIAPVAGPDFMALVEVFRPAAAVIIEFPR